ncbi:MAG: phosphoribosylformylglycinamidine synthase subunit PurL [Verrucomicrobia bacterium]|nr:MAG: phosphoribosylformylglycinamidine synthase subunit PurL [Verrucomicrobiota bacterium]
MKITPEIIQRHGLTPEEYEKILTILGREPSLTELGVFSVMWSEHCSYKNSRRELRKFPTTGVRVLVKAGEENAGVIDIGDGWAVAFKIESHNHPSAVEPFQGAATGVGGIIRDIFTMGARPVFCLDSLRFGPIEGEKDKANRRLFSNVVAGIAHYGNCMGIPTVGGEVYFDESYAGNPLVNVFCLGILRHDQIARGAAEGVGNPVFYVGAETGRDGLAGAAFASRELTEQSKQDRPAVQVGDPFREKLLLEACLELLASGCVAGIQDMGAAGLTCSTCETASRGGTGVEIDLRLVPQRETGMTPYEILLSESQERMLVIVKQGQEARVSEIFKKWDLPYSRIGIVRDDGKMRVRDGERVVVDIPARALADEAPVYEREVGPKRMPPPPLRLDAIPQADPLEALPQLLGDPNLASKRWVWQQYDHSVRLGAAVPPGSDAAVFIVREANKILAATSDCNALYCRQDPRNGARIAVAEAARNLACSGAVPLAVTDNLNFGNPYKPENFLQLREAVEGLAEACERFGTPVTGGNVSLYNESPTGSIDPTPTVAMVGLIEDPQHITTQFFKKSGDALLLIGLLGDELGASHYLKIIHGCKKGPPPELDYGREIAVQQAVLALIRRGVVHSAHDCSEGGLAVALAESAISGPTLVGAMVNLDNLNGGQKLRADQMLFNESQSRILISLPESEVPRILSYLEEKKVPAQCIGSTTEEPFLCITAAGTPWKWSLENLYSAWGDSLERMMQAPSVS